MTGLEIAAGVLLLALIPAGAAAVHGDVGARLVGLQTAASIATLVAVVLAMIEGRSWLLDVAIVLALLQFAGGLVFARFLERWL